MKWPFGSLPRNFFSCVLADPPWSFKTYSNKGLDKSPQLKYDCMTLEEIKALPVVDLCLPDSHLFLWATAPMLPQAIETMSAWGFTFKSAGAWAKRSSADNSWAFGTGFIYRSAVEFYLVGSRGSPKIHSRSVRNLIVEPVREHSRKPDQIRKDIELLTQGPRVELFRREIAPG